MDLMIEVLLHPHADNADTILLAFAFWAGEDDGVADI
jgi:hypothetical protein